MTELEKAKCADFNSIDLNKLVEEIRSSKQKYIEKCRATTHDFEEFKKIDIKEHLNPAHEMLHLLNAVLMKVGVQEVLIDNYAAALAVMRSTLIETSHHAKKHEAGSRIVEQVLSNSIGVIHASVPDPHARKTEED